MNLLLLAVACATFGSIFWIGWQYVAVHSLPLAVVILSAWIFGLTPWALIVLITLGDLLYYLSAGGVVFFPAMIRLAKKEEHQRKVVGRPRMTEVETIRLVLSMITFYTNPFTPLIVGAATFLGSRPPLETEIASFIDRTQNRPRAYRVVGEVGVDWRRNAGRPTLTA